MKGTGLSAYFFGFLMGVFVLNGFSLKPAPAHAIWVSGGPAGGSITCMAVALSNPDIMYAGTPGGIFKSVDGGITWANTSFFKMPVRAVAVDPTNQDIVYAGTDCGAPPLSPDDGIYRSGDGGMTWEHNGLSGARINVIVIDPSNSQTIYAGTGKPESSYSGEIVGIFKSTDGGGNWQDKLSEGLDAVAAILIDLESSNVVYAGVYGGDGFRKSVDAGENWTGIDVDDSDVVALAMNAAVDPYPAMVYAMTWGGDVFKSSNQGGSWSATNAPWVSSSPPWALAIDPNTPWDVYMATRDDCPGCLGQLYKCSFGGEWSLKSNGLPLGKPSSIVFDPRDSDIYTGLLEGGVYKSSDGGETWNMSSQGMKGTYVMDLAVHPLSSSTAYAAVAGEVYQLAKTINGGSSWAYLNNSPANLSTVTLDPQSPETLIVGQGWQVSNNFFIYKSTDGGLSWSAIGFVSFSSALAGKVSDIVIKPDDPECILVAAQFDAELNLGAFARTMDGGQTWQELGSMSTFTALAFGPTNPHVVFVGTKDLGQVFRYNSVWGNWLATEITPDSGIGDVRDIEVDSDSNVYVAASDGLWRWNGSGWVTFAELSSYDVRAVAIDRNTSPATIYAGTSEHGVFASRNGGSSWLPMNQGLETLSITKLGTSAAQANILYAGTAYCGAWSMIQCDPGDINGDGRVDLVDGILALKGIAGLDSIVIQQSADINADSKIGLEEVIYVLQHVGDLRN
jgi:photosystem II stability/assembly factor-like uncharacterized protein